MSARQVVRMLACSASIVGFVAVAPAMAAEPSEPTAGPPVASEQSQPAAASESSAVADSAVDESSDADYGSPGVSDAVDEFDCEIPNRGPVYVHTMSFPVQKHRTFSARYCGGGPKWARVELRNDAGTVLFNETLKRGDASPHRTLGGTEKFWPKVWADAEGGDKTKKIKLRIRCHY